MLWQAEWGKYSGKLKAIGKAKKPPKLHADLGFVWSSFVAVSKTRGVNREPITWGEIESYLNLQYVVDITKRQEIAHLIRIMDEKLLKFYNDRDNDKGQQNSKFRRNN